MTNKQTLWLVAGVLAGLALWRYRAAVLRIVKPDPTADTSRQFRGAGDMPPDVYYGEYFA